MAQYNCFNCGRDIKNEYIRKKVRCVHCGSKILYKAQRVSKVIKAI